MISINLCLESNKNNGQFTLTKTFRNKVIKANIRKIDFIFLKCFYSRERFYKSCFAFEMLYTEHHNLDDWNPYFSRRPYKVHYTYYAQPKMYVPYLPSKWKLCKLICKKVV